MWLWKQCCHCPEADFLHTFESLQTCHHTLDDIFSMSWYFRHYSAAVFLLVALNEGAFMRCVLDGIQCTFCAGIPLWLWVGVDGVLTAPWSFLTHSDFLNHSVLFQNTGSFHAVSVYKGSCILRQHPHWNQA